MVFVNIAAVDINSPVNIHVVNIYCVCGFFLCCIYSMDLRTDYLNSEQTIQHIPVK